jgi:hypothetical protein
MRPKTKPAMIVTAAVLPPTLLVVAYRTLVKKYHEVVGPPCEAVIEALAKAGNK